MKLEHYPVEKLKQDILGIVSKHLTLKDFQVFFFDSRVNGKATERSDIDVGIEGASEIPLEIMGKISEDLTKLPILYKVELVDFKRVPADFRAIALKSIEIISESK